ncbi:MAG: outer membrane beta-barrel protein [Deltaproteobacteria bacterium]|nr:outer membrane beta-barrel protein [Deltaproteobacteria bacterium]
MKKIITLAGALSLALLTGTINAEAPLEISGNATVMMGWQHDDGGALPGPGGEFSMVRGLRAPNRDTFNFYLDQVEIDIEKSFGDKIRLRADLDFGRALSGSGRSTEGANFVVEQAYMTVGVLGGELAIGRFNAPVGYYLVDRVDNPTISYANIYNFLTPTNMTGAKMHWEFDNGLDLQVYAVNSMFDCLQIGGSCLTGPRTGPGTADSAIPSFGTRLGYNWGSEETASTIGLAYIAGPEQGQNAHWDHLVDLDFAIKATENLLIAGEAIYYQRNNLSGVTGPNAKFIGGLLVLDWQMNELWDLYGSYGYVHDIQGVVTGLDQQVHNGVIGFGYKITDDAKFKMEYRLDYFQYAKNQGPRTAIGPVTLGDTSSVSHGLAGEFSYRF